MIELPRLTARDRDGKASLWTGDFHIWDISWEHATPEVLNAIASAYEHGVEFARSYMLKSIQGMPHMHSMDKRWEINRGLE